FIYYNFQSPKLTLDRIIIPHSYTGEDF
ncbi:hypothetical protein HKBW3S43_01091, partial [Candidatus Hakubella thermalkaliphila]